MLTSKQQDVQDRFIEGRKAYIMRDFATARQRFAEALKIDLDNVVTLPCISSEIRDEVFKDLKVEPKDGPSAVYYVRCKELMRNPPDHDWDGVYEMKTK